MENRIKYSPQALRDLDEIWDYIIMELCNPDAALNTVGRITDAVDKLRVFPEMGSLLSTVLNIESSYRCILSGNYMVFYRIEGEDVVIDRIIYKRRSYLQILFKCSSESNE